MCLLVSVATAIASIVDDNQLKDDYIIPKIDDPRIIHIIVIGKLNYIINTEIAY